VNSTIIRAAYGQFDADSSDVPTEFTLLKAGLNGYDDGQGEILFDDIAAQSVMARYQRRKIDLMADYEHQSLEKPAVEAPASAKKWVPEVRNGDLVATNIQWTKRAADMIAAREYRYWSIAARIEKATGRVVQIINFALTNNPAADGISPLVAASLLATGAEEPEETTMKTVLVALGLSAETEESAAVAAAAGLADLKREILALTAKPTTAEALGVLRAQAQSHEQVVQLNGRVAQLEAEKRAQEFDALVHNGEASAQISPAMAKGEWIAQLRGKVDGCEQLRAFLASAPKLAQSSIEAPKEAQSASGDAELTAAEIAVAKKFVAEGDDEALNKRLEDIRALKRADRKRAA
jgi:phage I-like protein